jgi:iron complex transport system ATP-binding protein
MCLQVIDLQIRRRGEICVYPLSFVLKPGTLLGVIGPNGAGKSTLLSALACLIPYQGFIGWHGQSLTTWPRQQMAQQIAYLAQADQIQWPLSVWDLVALARIPHQRSRHHQVATDQAAITAALTAVGIESLRQRRLDTLSGGERARARLARLLAVQAALLLVDEPIAALDPYYRLQVMHILQRQAQQGRCVVLVVHDLTLASRFCHQLLLLHQGHAIAYGQPEQVLTTTRLADIYGITALTGYHHNQAYIVPWDFAAASAP